MSTRMKDRRKVTVYRRSSIPSGIYTIDKAHTRLGFISRYAMVNKVRGEFTEYDAVGVFNDEQPWESHITLTIDAGSITTGNEKRDAHLRSNDFFDMANHPIITYTSNSITATAMNSLSMMGRLTIKENTHLVNLYMRYTGISRDEDGTERIGLTGIADIDRREYGLLWNVPLDDGGLLVGNKATLDLDISAIRKPLPEEDEVFVA